MVKNMIEKSSMHVSRLAKSIGSFATFARRVVGVWSKPCVEMTTNLLPKNFPNRLLWVRISVSVLTKVAALGQFMCPMTLSNSDPATGRLQEVH